MATYRRTPIPAFLFTLTACLLLFGCDRSRVLEENQQIAAHQWDYADGKTFVADIADTALHYNIYVNIRHTFSFEWRNVWVKIETTFPDSSEYEKRVNLVLSEPDGHWYGDCLGDNCDMRVPIQMNAIFPQKGKYVFKISQDMRTNPLAQIKSIGLRIEKAGKAK